MQGWPINSFNGGIMLAKASDGLITILADLPEHEFVIIASWSKHILVMGTPAQSTNFLTVTLQNLNCVLLS